MPLNLINKMYLYRNTNTMHDDIWFGYTHFKFILLIKFPIFHPLVPPHFANSVFFSALRSLVCCVQILNNIQLQIPQFRRTGGCPFVIWTIAHEHMKTFSLSFESSIKVVILQKSICLVQLKLNYSLSNLDNDFTVHCPRLLQDSRHN